MKYLIIANWKMNPVTYKEARKLLDSTRRATESAKKVALIVAPPSIYLRDLRDSYKGKRIAFAAQNAHFEKSGSFTGEISPAQIKDSKITHVILGHAERRAVGESDDLIKNKIIAALAGGLVPILCVGETKRNSDGDHYTFVRTQLTAALEDVPAAKVGGVVIAYEPVWAIGADKSMSPREMHEMAIFIRKMIVEMHGNVGMSMKILYGGAIDETNAAQMLTEGNVDGLLVGRASVEPARFKALIETVSEL